MSPLTKFITLTSLLLAAAPALSDDTFVLLPKRAAAVPKFSLWPRSSFFGGVSLSAKSCPKNTIACDGDSHLQKGACCPTGTVCFGGGLNGGVSCCPDKNDCTDLVTAAPVCADSKWELYAGFENDFCCQTGEKGVVYEDLTNINGLCIPEDAPLTTSSATKIGGATQETGTAEPSSATDASTTDATATPTGSSTPKGTSSGGSTASSATAAGATSTGAAGALGDGRSGSLLTVVVGAVGVLVARAL